MQMAEESEEVIINSLETLKTYIAGKDNSKSFVYFSKIPQICKDEPCELGLFKN
jgi:ribonuclease H2 subunit A